MKMKALYQSAIIDKGTPSQRKHTEHNTYTIRGFFMNLHKIVEASRRETDLWVCAQYCIINKVLSQVHCTGTFKM
jgi:hypothetical protein